MTREYSNTMTQYDWQKDKLNTDISRSREDYQKYVSRTGDETTRQLMMNNKDFASKLSAATSAYGQRGIMRSGLANIQTASNTGDFNTSNTYYKIGQQNKLNDAATGMSRNEADYTTGVNQNNVNRANTTDKYNTLQGRNTTDKANYASDRAVGASILMNDLQSKGDSLYNSTVTASMDTTRKKAEQDAINKLYGIQPSETRVPYRLGGKYIF